MRTIKLGTPRFKRLVMWALKLYSPSLLGKTLTFKEAWTGLIENPWRAHDNIHPRARLDPDGTAKPLTSLAEVRRITDDGRTKSQVYGPANTYIAEDGEHIPLTGRKER